MNIKIENDIIFLSTGIRIHIDDALYIYKRISTQQFLKTFNNYKIERINNNFKIGCTTFSIKALLKFRTKIHKYIQEKIFKIGVHVTTDIGNGIIIGKDIAGSCNMPRYIIKLDNNVFNFNKNEYCFFEKEIEVDKTKEIIK
jgi:hypothetical protein